MNTRTKPKASSESAILLEIKAIAEALTKRSGRRSGASSAALVGRLVEGLSLADWNKISSSLELADWVLIPLRDNTAEALNALDTLDALDAEQVMLRADHALRAARRSRRSRAFGGAEINSGAMVLPEEKTFLFSYSE